MPIYEFYCQTCNTLLNFFSRKVNTTTLPACPHCGSTLSRQVSPFATPTSGDCSDELGDAPFDESKMQDAVDKFGDKLDSLGDSDDPRKSAEMMRQFSEASGLSFNPDIREAITRLERGEDPDTVSADMDSIIEGGADPFAPSDRGRKPTGVAVPPTKDKTLYDL